MWRSETRGREHFAIRFDISFVSRIFSFVSLGHPTIRLRKCFPTIASYPVRCGHQSRVFIRTE